MLLITILLSGCSGRNENVDISWADNKFFAHALGKIDVFPYTNCYEALIENYERGFRVFEVDLYLTSDGKLACTHAWEAGYQGDFSPERIPTMKEYLDTPIAGIYTPILFSDLCRFMIEHEDVYIITDTKETARERIIPEFEELLREANDYSECLNRMIVQVYNDEMFEVVDDIYHFDHYIYTLYFDWDASVPDANDRLKRYCKFVKKNGIDGITLHESYFEKEGTVDILKNNNINFFFHTVNDENRALELLKGGASGIYTDSLLIEY